MDIKIRGTHKKVLKSVFVPFSGVKPKLYEINAIGADKATPKHIREQISFIIMATNFGVI